MKIALIIEHFDPARGGAENFTCWLAGQLVNLGHEVHVLCHDSARRRDKYQAATHGASHDAARSAGAGGPVAAVVDGVQVHRIKALRLSSGVGFRQFGRAADRWCRQHKPDITHSMTVAYPGNLYHPHAGVYRRIQEQAVASRETAPRAGWKQFLLSVSGKQRALLKLEQRAASGVFSGRPQAIICISPMMQRDLSALYGIPINSLPLLENPLMLRRPAALEMAEMRKWFRDMYKLNCDAKVAVFAGHDFRRKGLAAAVRAIAAAKTPWRLLVVGLGKVRPYLDLARRLGVADRVVFVGPTREMTRVYSAGDALLLPTFYDSYGLVAMEALTCGLPVISTRFLGCGELLAVHGLATIVDSPRNVAGLADALDSVDTAWDRRTERADKTFEVAAASRPENYMRNLVELYNICGLPPAEKKGN